MELVAAAAQIRSLAWKPPYAVGEAKKKKKRKFDFEYAFRLKGKKSDKYIKSYRAF